MKWSITQTIIEQMVILAVTAGALGMCPSVGAAEPDAQKILLESDNSRGGGDLPGLVWEIQTHNSGTGADEQVDQSLRIKVINNASLAEIQEPPSSKGTKILQADRNMWLSRPGLKKPIAISPRQRLSGQTALGDIAATNYGRDYTATYLREESVANEPCYVLDLTASSRSTTYDRITYWVSIKRNVAVQAEFLSLSGKVLKRAQFEYGNSISVQGKSYPFVSKMSIFDALSDARTDMQYKHIKTQAVPRAEFDVGNM